MAERDIIIKGEFTIEGLGAMRGVTQPLKYLKLRIGYPPPPIQVEQLQSLGRKKGEISEIRRFKKEDLEKNKSTS